MCAARRLVLFMPFARFCFSFVLLLFFRSLLRFSLFSSLAFLSFCLSSLCLRSSFVCCFLCHSAFCPLCVVLLLSCFPFLAFLFLSFLLLCLCCLISNIYNNNNKYILYYFVCVCVCAHARAHDKDAVIRHKKREC